MHDHNGHRHARLPAHPEGALQPASRGEITLLQSQWQKVACMVMMDIVMPGC